MKYYINEVEITLQQEQLLQTGLLRTIFRDSYWYQFSGWEFGRA